MINSLTPGLLDLLQGTSLLDELFRTKSAEDELGLEHVLGSLALQPLWINALPPARNLHLAISLANKESQPRSQNLFLHLLGQFLLGIGSGLEHGGLEGRLEVFDCLALEMGEGHDALGLEGLKDGLGQVSSRTDDHTVLHRALHGSSFDRGQLALHRALLGRSLHRPILALNRTLLRAGPDIFLQRGP